MPRYYPIGIPVELKASASDLVAFRWETNGIAADFEIPGDEANLLRVTFNSPCIVRILDEGALNTESDSSEEGLVSEHFAYRVEGAAFMDAQSSTWKITTTAHYRLITGWACMDVVSHGQPSFALIKSTSVELP